VLYEENSRITRFPITRTYA